ncbi:MAG: hypothetical protein IJW16_02235 [Clostridia bacterium]|nr:hypothetical protein [Clostridia bacterium]
MAYNLTAQERRARAYQIAQNNKLQAQQQQAFSASAAAPKATPVQEEDDDHWLERVGATIGDVLSGIGYGAIKGVEGIVDAGATLIGGAADLFGADDVEKGVSDFTSYDFTSDLFGRDDNQGSGTGKVNLFDTQWGNELIDKSYLDEDSMVRSVAEGFGGMLPAVGVSLIPGVGAAVPAIMMGVQAGGQSAEEAFNEGASGMQALGYGTAMGTVEAATEKLGGIMAGGSSELSESVLGKFLIKHGKDDFWRKSIGKAMYTFGSEGLEEALTDVIQPGIKGGFDIGTAREDYFGKDAGENWGEVLKSLPKTFAVGGATGVLMGSLHSGINNLKNRDKGGGKYNAVAEEVQVILDREKADQALKRSGRATQEQVNKLETRIRTQEREAVERISHKMSKMTEAQRERAFAAAPILHEFIETDGAVKSDFMDALSEQIESGKATNTTANVFELSQIGEDTRAAIESYNEQHELTDGTEIRLYEGDLTAEERQTFATIAQRIKANGERAGTDLNLAIIESNRPDVQAFRRGNTFFITKEDLTSGKWAERYSHELGHFASGTEGRRRLANYLAGETRTPTAGKHATAPATAAEAQFRLDKSKSGRYNKKEVAQYIPYGKVGNEVVRHIKTQLKKIYNNEDGVADEIAIEYGDYVYMVDSGRENGSTTFGIRRKIKISDARLRAEFIRSTNNDAVSKRFVSDEISSRIGDEVGSDWRRNMRRESGTELQPDSRESQDNQSGISGENADNRGLNVSLAAEAEFRLDENGFDIDAEKQYNDFGWARENNVLSPTENARLRSLFAEAVTKNYFPRTKSGEYMIEIGDRVTNKIAYMTGSIDEPVITRVLLIDEHNGTKLSEIRGDVYETERRGIQTKTEGIFRLYYRSDFGDYVFTEGGIRKGTRYNNQLGAERGAGSRTTQKAQRGIQSPFLPVVHQFQDLTGRKRNVRKVNKEFMIEGSTKAKYSPTIEDAVRAENDRIIKRYARMRDRTVTWVKQKLSSDPDFLKKEYSKTHFSLAAEGENTAQEAREGEDAPTLSDAFYEAKNEVLAAGYGVTEADIDSAWEKSLNGEEMTETEELAYEELVARLIDHALGTEASVRRMASKAPKLARMMLDRISDMVDTMRGTNADRAQTKKLRRAELMLEDALDEIRERNKKAEKDFKRLSHARDESDKHLSRVDEDAERELARLKAEFASLAPADRDAWLDAHADTVDREEFEGEFKRTYSYDELVAKDDLQGVVIGKDQQVKIKTDAIGNIKIDNEDVLETVRSKCEKLEKEGTKPTYYVSISDIGENVEITRKGIEHSYHGSAHLNKMSTKDKDDALINARVALELPQVLSNSIEVNISDRQDNANIPYAHILMGTVALKNADGSLEYYAVRSVIEERIGQDSILAEWNIVGKLHGSLAKKIGSPKVRTDVKKHQSPYSSEAYVYSIADFLENVKGVFDNTFSKDVYEKLGVSRKDDDFSKPLHFSLAPSSDKVVISKGERETWLKDHPDVKDVKDLEESEDDKKAVKKAFSDDFTARIVNSFGIDKLNDSIHVQRQVLNTLLNEGFFTDSENKRRSDVNEESGLVIEINKSGIDETFSFNNFSRLGRFKKIAKLATIRELPNVIKQGHLIADNVDNKYANAINKKFAYIEYATEIEGERLVVKLAIKKSPQKNKFWVHSIYTTENVSGSPASTSNGAEAGHITADNERIISQPIGLVKRTREKSKVNFSLEKGQSKEPESKKRFITRKDAAKIVNSIVYKKLNFEKKYGKFDYEDYRKAVDLMFRRLNKASEGEFDTVVKDIAEFIVQTAVVEDTVRSEDLQKEYDELAFWQQYMRGVDLSSVAREIKSRFPEFGKQDPAGNPNVGASIYASWGKIRNKPFVSFEKFLKDAEDHGFEFASDDPIERLKEINRHVKDLRERINNRAKTFVEEAFPADQIDALKKEIERNIRSQYKKYGKADNFDSIVDRYQTRITGLIEEVRDTRSKNNVENHLLNRLEALRDLKYGTYQSAATFKDPLFKGSLEELSKIKYRWALQDNRAREISEKLGLWYTSQNPLFENEDGFYRQDIHDMLLQIANGEGALTTFEMRMLTNVVDHFIHIVQNHNKVYRNGKLVDAMPLAKAYIEKIALCSKTKAMLVMRSLAKDRSYIRQFGDPAALFRAADQYDPNGFYTEVYEDLRRGAIGMAFTESELMHDYEEFLKKHKKYLDRLQNETVLYQSRQIPLNRAISLYMTTKRRQAWKGLIKSGFFIEMDVKDGKKTLERRARVDFNELLAPGQEIQDHEIEGLVKQTRDALYSHFSEADKEFIKIIEKTLNEECSALKRQTDLDRMGYSNVEEGGYYYPIQRADVTQNADTNPKAMYADLDLVSHLSMNADLVEGAAGRLLIRPVEDIFLRHVKQVAMYSNLAIPFDSYNRILNLNTDEANRNKPVSVRSETSRTALGQEMNKYLRELIEDVQGVGKENKNSWWHKTVSFVRSGYAKAQLGGNPKVWLTQLSSFIAATDMLDYGCLVKGISMSDKWKEVDQYCHLAMIRNKDNVAAHAQGVLDKTTGKVGDALMKPIGRCDRFVVGTLFGACQVQIQKNGGAKVGTEENKKAAGELLERVILETQQNALSTERSAAMRSGDELLKSLTMFSADSMKVFARVLDAYGEVATLRRRLQMSGFSEEQKAAMKAQLKRAHRKAVRSTVALVASAAFMAALALFFRWLYRKEEEKTGEERTQEIIADTVGNLLGGLPFIRDVYSYFSDGYELDNFMLSTINDLLLSTQETVNMSFDLIQGKDVPQKDITVQVRKSFYAAGQLFGIPVRNMYNHTSGLIKRCFPETGYKLENHFYSQNYRADLQRALENEDEEMLATIVGIMLDEKVGGIESSAARKALNELVLAGHDVIPSGVPESLTLTYKEEEYAVSDKDRKIYKQIYLGANEKLAEMVRLKSFQNATDEEKAAAVNLLYSSYKTMAKYEVLEGMGVELEEHCKIGLFAEAMDLSKLVSAVAVARAFESDKDKHGKVIAGSKKKKVIAYVQSLNLTAVEKYMIMGFLGYTNTKGKTAVRAHINSLNLAKSEKAQLLKWSGYPEE